LAVEDGGFIETCGAAEVLNGEQREQEGEQHAEADALAAAPSPFIGGRGGGWRGRWMGGEGGHWGSVKGGG
jgi:hypothetical protein